MEEASQAAMDVVMDESIELSPEVVCGDESTLQEDIDMGEAAGEALKEATLVVPRPLSCQTLEALSQETATLTHGLATGNSPWRPHSNIGELTTCRWVSIG